MRRSFRDPAWLAAVTRRVRPSPPYLADLRVWIDPEDLDGAGNATLSNGAAVASLVVNKGSIGGSFTSDGSTVPTYSAAGGPGGRPCLTFVNGGLQSSLALSAFTFLHDGTAWTAYLVFRTTLANPNAIQALMTTAFTLGSSSSRGTSIFHDDRAASGREDRAMAYVSSGSTLNFSLQSADDDAPAATWSILGVRAQGANPFLQIVVNGSLKATATALTGSFSALIPTISLKLGRAGASSSFAGLMADIMVYAGRHDDTQRAAVEAWITSQTPGGFPQ